MDGPSEATTARQDTEELSGSNLLVLLPVTGLVLDIHCSGDQTYHLPP